MHDLKRNKKRMMNKQISPIANKVNSEEKHVEKHIEKHTEELSEELSRACGYKPKSESHHEHGCHKDQICGCNTKHHHCDCECGCNTKPKCEPCEPCEIEAKECIENNCGPECCDPIALQKFSTTNSVPYAIEAKRIFDTMVFQTFTDAAASNGEALNFDYDVIEVNGPIPRVGQVDVTIEKICLNYSGIVIDAPDPTLEDYDLQRIDPINGNSCETSFEYAVCGEKYENCSQQGKGKSVVYKQRGLTIAVEDLVLELRCKCGCTEIIVLAYPSSKGSGGHNKKCEDVEFTFNTLSAPICVPSDGRNFILKQDFETSLTVDCIGKALLRYIDHEGCEGYYDFCIPNDIDLIMCLEATVSILLNDQIVVLGAPNTIQPRVVDTFTKVCDFKKNESENKTGNCGCKR